MKELCGGIAGVHRNHSGWWDLMAKLNHRGVKRVRDVRDEDMR